jgi:hypothetical protein
MPEKPPRTPKKPRRISRKLENWNTEKAKTYEELKGSAAEAVQNKVNRRKRNLAIMEVKRQLRPHGYKQIRDGFITTDKIKELIKSGQLEENDLIRFLLQQK